MATYILLMTLTPEGQQQALKNPEYLLRAAETITVPGVQSLGLYAVLGGYDFITIVEAGSNEEIARFSLELGVNAHVHITTRPAIPISRLEDEESLLTATAEAEVEVPSEVARELRTERQSQDLAP